MLTRILDNLQLLFLENANFTRIVDLLPTPLNINFYLRQGHIYIVVDKPYSMDGSRKLKYCVKDFYFQQSARSVLYESTDRAASLFQS